jgi:small subunit ribosomal protein S16
MALKIRLARGGAKKRPFYRIVVAENTSPRDGKFVERIGSYNPILPADHAERVVINAERAKHWLSVGAQPTERVEKFLAKISLVAQPAQANRPQQSQPKKKAQERLKAEAEAKAAAAEAAAQAAAAPAAPEVVEAPAEEVAPAPEAVVEVVAPAAEEASPDAEESAPAAE